MSCSHCVRGFPLPGEPKGVLRSDLMLDVYLASPNPSSEQWKPSSRAVLLADRFSQELGCDVWVPNCFDHNYCWGGSMLYHIAQTHAIESAVIVHPGGYKDEQLRAIRMPVSWALAEDCDYIKQKQIDNAEAIFAARKGKENFVEYEFKVYPGTAHGFAARPNLALPAIKEGFERAFEQAVNWFKKTLF
ncbi:hypothetical protein GGF50DRAFT_127038 [Schizophyllum commune]